MMRGYTSGPLVIYKSGPCADQRLFVGVTVFHHLNVAFYRSFVRISRLVLRFVFSTCTWHEQIVATSMHENENDRDSGGTFCFQTLDQFGLG